MSELPKGWYVTEIKNVLKTQDGNKLVHQGWSPKCLTEPAKIGEWGVLKTTAIQDGHFLEEHNKKLPLDKEPKVRLEVKPGDLLMTNAGPRKRCGITTFVHQVRSKLMISGKMYRMRFDPEIIYPKYMELYLRSSGAQKAIDERKTGMSESGLNLTQDRFLSLPVIMCPVAVQKRIADKLDSVLAKVEAAQARLDKIPAILKRFRQSVLAAATSGELSISESFNDQDYFIELKQRLNNAKSKSKRKPLSEAEIDNAKLNFNVTGWERWKLYPLEDLVQPDRGIPYGIVQTGEPTEGGIPTVRCGDVKPLRINEDFLKCVAPEIEDKYKRTRLSGGEVLLAIRGTVGNAAVVSESLAKRHANISREVAMIPLLENVSAEYIALLLQSPGGSLSLGQKVRGVAQKGINLADVKRFVTPLPTYDEQKFIVEKINELMLKADFIEKQYQSANHKLNKLSQSILAKAFKGELLSSSVDSDIESIENSVEALNA